MSAARKYKREYGGPMHRMAKPKGKRAPVVLAPTHPAIKEGRPLFQTAVDAADSPRLLVSGMNSRKIGRKVTKGAWSGMPIYTLTLEERASCPASCTEWANCYGNNMPFARRHRFDESLIVILMMELREKALEHQQGFVVRAHVLGDFGSDRDEQLSLAYVSMWRLALEEVSGLHMFSYTAHEPDSTVGHAIMALNTSFPDRCRVRFSGHDLGAYGAVVIEEQADSRHVICPAELNQTDCCGTCGLCWSMDRTVEFVRH